MNLASWFKDPATVFNILDKRGDGSISYDEWMSEFERLDGDGDGVIQRKAWSVQMGETDVFDTLPHAAHNAITREEWRAAFIELDANRDRRISAEEWKALSDASYGAPPTPPPSKGYQRLAPTERLLGRALDHLCGSFGLDREEVYLCVRDALPEDVWEALWKGMINDELKHQEDRLRQKAESRSRSQPVTAPAPSEPTWLRSGPSGWRPVSGRMTPLPQDASDADSDRIHYVFGRQGPGGGRESELRLREVDQRWDSDRESDFVAPPPRLHAPGAGAARRGRRNSVSISPDDLAGFQAGLAGAAPPSPGGSAAASPRAAGAGASSFSTPAPGLGRFAFAAGKPSPMASTGVAPFASTTPFGAVHNPAFFGTGRSLESTLASAAVSPTLGPGLAGGPASPSGWSLAGSAVGQGGLSPEELATWLRHLPSTRIEDDTKRLIAKSVVDQGIWSNMFLEKLASRRWASLGVEDQWQATKILELWKLRKPENAQSLSSWMRGRASPMH